MALIGCGFCKGVPTSLGHEMLKFPTGVLVDLFHCVKCGAILSVSRAPVENQPRQIVKPSAGEIEKLTQN